MIIILYFNGKMTEPACDRLNMLLKDAKPNTTFIMEDDLFQCKPNEEVLRGKRVRVVEFACRLPFEMAGRTSWVKNRITVTEGPGDYHISHNCY